MTILSDHTIVSRVQLYEGSPDMMSGLGIKPFVEKQKQAMGMSYGLGPAGYDIRLGLIDRKAPAGSPNDNGIGNLTSWNVMPGEFILLASLEWMRIPHDVVGKVCDKSTLARQGLALQNTVLEPGWEGYITLELSNHGDKPIQIRVGQPIAQVVFHLMDRHTGQPYKGKYQNQSQQPTQAIFKEDNHD